MTGAELQYRSWGASSAHALLMVHPLGAESSFWSGAADVLSEHFFCIACDLRSAGSSPGASEPVDVDTHAQDLDLLVKKLGLRSIVGIGCAVGAIIVAAFAARTAVEVNGLVLSNPAIRFTSQGKQTLSARAAIARRDGLEPLADEIVARAFHNMPDDIRRSSFRSGLTRGADAGPRYADIAEGIRDVDIADDLSRLRCPMLLLTSVNDVLLPPEHAEAVQRLAPHASIRHIDEAAHFIPFQAPGRFAAETLDFLRTLSTPATNKQQP